MEFPIGPALAAATQSYRQFGRTVGLAAFFRLANSGTGRLAAESITSALKLLFSDPRPLKASERATAQLLVGRLRNNEWPGCPEAVGSALIAWDSKSSFDSLVTQLADAEYARTRGSTISRYLQIRVQESIGKRDQDRERLTGCVERYVGVRSLAIERSEVAIAQIIAARIIELGAAKELLPADIQTLRPEASVYVWGGLLRAIPGRYRRAALLDFWESRAQLGEEDLLKAMQIASYHADHFADLSSIELDRIRAILSLGGIGEKAKDALATLEAFVLEGKPAGPIAEVAPGHEPIRSSDPHWRLIRAFRALKNPTQDDPAEAVSLLRRSHQGKITSAHLCVLRMALRGGEASQREGLFLARVFADAKPINGTRGYLGVALELSEGALRDRYLKRAISLGEAGARKEFAAEARARGWRDHRQGNLQAARIALEQAKAAQKR